MEIAVNVPLPTSSHFRPASRLSSIGVSEILKITGLAARAEAPGQGCHHPRRRRAGFRHAGSHQGRGGARHARRARRNTRRSTERPSSKPRSAPSSSATTALNLPGRDHGFKRCEAGHLQCDDGDARSGRRGDHPDAVLGDLRRYRPHCRRQAGAGAVLGSQRLPAHRRTISKRRSRRARDG